MAENSDVSFGSKLNLGLFCRFGRRLGQGNRRSEMETYLVSHESQFAKHGTHAPVGDSESRFGIGFAAEMWTIGAICSEASTLSLGDIVISVLRVTYDLGPNGWIILSELVVDSAVVQMESVFRNRPVHPEKIDSSALKKN